MNYCNCPNCRTVDCPNGKSDEQLEAENRRMRRLLASVVENVPIIEPKFRGMYLYEQCKEFAGTE